jgi:hypothetical protein
MENLLLDFLPSAQKYHPDSKIVVVGLGLSQSNIDILHSLNIFTYEIPVVISYNHTAGYLRWQYMAQFLEIEKDIDLFVITDCGDAFFQDNIFYNNPLKDGVGVVEEDHRADLGWSLARIHELPSSLHRSTIDAVRGHFMVNAGIVYGYRNDFIDFCNKVHCLINTPGTQLFFGLDQAHVNYLTRTMDNIHILPRTYNFIAQCMPYYIKDDIVYEQENNQIVKLVHNAGGRPIPRIFNGRNINKSHTPI